MLSWPCGNLCLQCLYICVTFWTICQKLPDNVQAEVVGHIWSQIMYLTTLCRNLQFQTILIMMTAGHSLACWLRRHVKREDERGANNNNNVTKPQNQPDTPICLSFSPRLENRVIPSEFKNWYTLDRHPGLENEKNSILSDRCWGWMQKRRASASACVRLRGESIPQQTWIENGNSSKWINSFTSLK